MKILRNYWLRLIKRKINNSLSPWRQNKKPRPPVCCGRNCLNGDSFFKRLIKKKSKLALNNNSLFQDANVFCLICSPHSSLPTCCATSQRRVCRAKRIQHLFCAVSMYLYIRNKLTLHQLTLGCKRSGYSHTLHSVLFSKAVALISFSGEAEAECYNKMT